MTSPQAHVVAAVRAARVVSPTAFTWFGRRHTTAPPGTSARLEPSIARTLLVAGLQRRLYADLYCSGRAVPLRAAPAGVLRARRTGFVDELAAANDGEGGWQRDCPVVAPDGAGAVVRLRGLNAWARETELRLRGDVADVRLPRDSLRASPGHYVAFGTAGIAPAGERPILRWYWHLTPQAAVRLVATATGALNAGGVAFTLKVLADPQGYDRCDAGVLYVERARAHEVARLLCPCFDEVLEFLRPGVPAFTKRLRPGLAVADEPGGGRSYGMARCELVAEGIVAAHERGLRTSRDRAAAVGEAFTAAGVDLRHPWWTGAPLRLRVSTRTRAGVTSTLLGSPSRPPADAARCASAAGALAERIASEAAWWEGRCTWMGTDPVGPPWRLRTLGPHLYGGVAGVALALGECAAATADAGLRRASLGGMAQARTLAEELDTASGGVHSGRPGVAVAAARLGTLLDRPDLGEWAVDELRRLRAPDARPAGHDLLGGAAGALLACLVVARIRGAADLVEIATELADDLLADAVREGEGLAWPADPVPARRPLCGLSHGASGIGCALLELWAATGSERARAGALAAFAYERACRDGATGNWPDFRTRAGDVEAAQPPAGGMVAWCHGAAGVALARLRAAELLADPVLAGEAASALAVTASALAARGHVDGPLDLGLCHGAAGNGAVLLEGVRRLGGAAPGLGEATEVLTAAVRAAEAAADGGPLPAGVRGGPTPALMVGAAGLVHFLVRAARPGLPSLLLPVPGAAWSRAA